jgi:hypothetical protein
MEPIIDKTHFIRLLGELNKFMYDLTWEAEIRRIAVQDQPRQIVLQDPHLQNKQNKTDWSCGSSGRVPAL